MAPLRPDDLDIKIAYKAKEKLQRFTSQGMAAISSHPLGMEIFLLNHRWYPWTSWAVHLGSLQRLLNPSVELLPQRRELNFRGDSIILTWSHSKPA